MNYLTGNTVACSYWGKWRDLTCRCRAWWLGSYNPV